MQKNNQICLVIIKLELQKDIVVTDYLEASFKINKQKNRTFHVDFGFEIKKKPCG